MPHPCAVKWRKKMNFKIVTDSSADLGEYGSIPFASVPLKIITDECEYVDDASLDVAKMLSELERYKGKSHSSLYLLS